MQDPTHFSIKNSINSAIQSAILVLKLIIPLFILAEILLYLDVLKYITFIFEPITDLLDLPKETSIGIAAAMFFNIYAGLAFLAPLHLSPYEWTILGTFLGIAHSLVVEKDSIPEIVKITSYSKDDNEIMSLEVEGYDIYGVQFHPESIMSEHGYKILDNFLKIRS